jgi:hypothetical protein
MVIKQKMAKCDLAFIDFLKNVPPKVPPICLELGA